MDLGYNPGRISKEKKGHNELQKPDSKTFYTLLVENLQLRRPTMHGNVPCPNLMQMRSSTIQIATDSQQKAPTFFTGCLQKWNIDSEKVKKKKK